jgi:acrylyl-CoA reductase (NADPH)
MTDLGDTFRAVFAAEPDGGAAGRLGTAAVADLPEGDLTVRVAYSSLNYKDGLAVTGKAPVVRRHPMVCGVDLAGSVVAAAGGCGFDVGDSVVVTGFGLGADHWGGFAELARVPAEWAVRLPDGLSARSAMAVGTAGLTSMLCVLALEAHGLTVDTAGELPVLVTGAAGGVGSVAVAVLARLGYRVAAASGRPEQEEYLRSLGAGEIVPRAELAEAPVVPLEKERYAGVVDAVGGATLATAIRRTRYGGTVAACGLAGGADLPTTVHPFILRGVTLAGVESVRCPMPLRETAWARLATDLPHDLLEAMTTVEPLARVLELAEDILAGRTRGRVVIDVNA